VTAYLVLALTVSTAIARPRVGRVRIQPHAAALGGALMMILLGLLPVPVVVETLGFLVRPVITIVGLMVITLVADRAGLFRLVAWRVARIAGGDARKLFAYLFVAGTITGALFTNDAAVLIFTPLVVVLMDEVQGPGWSSANRVPYYFAVLYVANVVGVFVTSNPINVLVGEWFAIGFAEYAVWMAAPALASILVSYLGLRWFFRRQIPSHCLVPGPAKPSDKPALLKASGIIMGLTLVGFWTEDLTGVPTAYVAGGAALVLLIVGKAYGEPVGRVSRAVGWDVVLFLIGMFLVAQALRLAGLTPLLGAAIGAAAEHGYGVGTLVTGLAAGGAAAVMNNHPVAGSFAMAITDLSLGEHLTRLVALAALIGGDLGPKMLPIGSLAALMWFRLLRDRGIEIPYRQYIRLGVPVSLAAIIVSLLVLNAQAALLAP
jgi:arsenical pump membrane protein